MQISKLPLPHGNLPRSVSSVNFNFERTNLSRNAFGLRKEARGGLGKIAFSIGTFVNVDEPLLIHQKQYVTLGEKTILGKYYPPDILDAF